MAMKLARAGLALLLTQALTAAIAVAQTAPAPVDDDDPTPGDPTPADPTPADPFAPEAGTEVPTAVTPDAATAAAEAEAAAAAAAKAAKDAKDAPGTAGYDKGFYVKSNDGTFGLKITGRLHPYYTFTRIGEPASNRGGFELRRARLVLEGNLHGKHLTYKLQTEFGRGVVGLRDFHFDLEVGSGVWLRVGQWKRPFSRQQIVSSGRQELSDRAITDRVFGAGRDIGLAIRNDYEKSPDLEWTVGVFNGTGIDPTQAATVNPDTGAVTIGNPSNVPQKFRPALVGRVGINRGGLKGYSEADLEGGPLRWGVGASVWVEGDFDENDTANDKAQLDYMVKVNGLSSTGGVYAMTEQRGLKPFSDQELEFVGFHLQGGYMVTPTAQVAARYAMISHDSDAARDQQEITIGGSYYGYGHDGKLQGAVRLIKTGAQAFGDTILFELTSNIGF